MVVEQLWERDSPRRYSIVSVTAVLLLALGLAIVPSGAAHAVSEVTATARIYADTNTHRRVNGLAPLVRNAQMDAIAAAWSQVQCERGVMAHNPHLADEIPSGWSAAAENVARGYTYDRVVDAWIDSPGHNANLLGRYTHIGIGYCELNGDRFYTQIFGRYPGALPGDGADDVGPEPAVLAIAPSGVLYRYPVTATGRIGTRLQIGVGWSAMSLVTGVADLTGDDYPDVVARDAGGRLLLYRGTPGGGLSGRTVIGPGWGAMNHLVAVGDITGDGHSDLIARDRTGRLWLYGGRGGGQFAGRLQIGHGWSAMTAIVGPGDVTSDGRPDLVAADVSGRLWLYPGQAGGRLGARMQVGSGWQMFDTVIAPGDLSGDGRPDLLGRTNAGALLLYTSTAVGSWRSGGQVGHGWRGLRIFGPGAE